MSKAEERVLEVYPIESHEMYDDLYRQRNAYVKGYHQAEKDNELTWKDMECIIKHYQDIMAEKSRVFVRAEDYKELLKRFNKEKKEK